MKSGLPVSAYKLHFSSGGFTEKIVRTTEPTVWIVRQDESHRVLERDAPALAHRFAKDGKGSFAISKTGSYYGVP